MNKAERCPWKCHFGTSQEATTQCAKPAHVAGLVITQTPEGFLADVDGDSAHVGPNPWHPDLTVHWQAGDRREYQGDWPGPCPHQPCILHAGHHGRHAP